MPKAAVDEEGDLCRPEYEVRPREDAPGVPLGCKFGIDRAQSGAQLDVATPPLDSGAAQKVDYRKLRGTVAAPPNSGYDLRAFRGVKDACHVWPTMVVSDLS